MRLVLDILIGARVATPQKDIRVIYFCTYGWLNVLDHGVSAIWLFRPISTSDAVSNEEMVWKSRVWSGSFYALVFFWSNISLGTQITEGSFWSAVEKQIIWRQIGSLAVGKSQEQSRCDSLLIVNLGARCWGLVMRTTTDSVSSLVYRSHSTWGVCRGCVGPLENLESPSKRVNYSLWSTVYLFSFSANCTEYSDCTFAK